MKSNPMKETHVNIVLGGCGRSAKSVEFSALVVVGCIAACVLIIALIAVTK